ncbi:MAG TPA: hypothetical protein VE404_09680, partial [Verrucomicrobiae bacterium]|nr:hypothetical protein [Verrucomicrobiae bacterium]
ASSLSAARVSAAAPAIGEPQVGAADTTCAEAAVDQSTAGKPCKTCSDKPYCKCTYNGQPRISCDPCCYYGTYAGEICLD